MPFDLSMVESASVKEEAFADESVMDGRRAIMSDPRLIDIVLGPADNSRIIHARLDESERVVYPAFKV